jgi:hydroxymethylpyrimidine/phosphomethylpyrimidine kinase
MEKELFPLATVITPNLDEAEALLDQKVRSTERMESAARELNRRFGCAVLLKGGHLRGKEALDLFFDGKKTLRLSSPYIKGVSTHGTGCTYSAAMAAYLALGLPLPEAIRKGKRFISESIRQSRRVRRHFVLNPFWRSPDRQ